MCQPMPSTSYDASSDDLDCCWICLGEGGILSRPCMCPRSVHPACLARWQLQQAGRKEERSCRFCNASLPDWKAQLAPAPPTPVEPVMVVSLGGKAVKMRVKPGPEGMSQFRQQVRELFNIPADVDFECSFKCKAPSGDTIQLDGLASYEAATHCASLMAAQRAAAAGRRAASVPHPQAHPHPMQPQPQTQQQQQLGHAASQPLPRALQPQQRPHQESGAAPEGPSSPQQQQQQQAYQGPSHYHSHHHNQHQQSPFAAVQQQSQQLPVAVGPHAYPLPPHAHSPLGVSVPVYQPPSPHPMQPQPQPQQVSA